MQVVGFDHSVDHLGHTDLQSTSVNGVFLIPCRSFQLAHAIRRCRFIFVIFVGE
jgi:hypothetical protein